MMDTQFDAGSRFKDEPEVSARKDLSRIIINNFFNY